MDRLDAVDAAFKNEDYDRAYELSAALHAAHKSDELVLSAEQRAELALVQFRCLLALDNPGFFDEAAEHLEVYGAFAGTSEGATLVAIAQGLLELAEAVELHRTSYDPDGVMWARYRGRAFEHIERCRICEPAHPAIAELRARLDARS